MTTPSSSSGPQLPKTALPLPTPQVKTTQEDAAVRVNEKVFGKMDKNKDGSLSEDEVVDGAKGYKGKLSELKFKDYDKNSDGKITTKEFAKGRVDDRQMSQELSVGRASDTEYKVRDLDKSGGLSAKELGQHGEQKVEKYDKDGNGELDKKEFMKLSTDRHERELAAREKAAKPSAPADKPVPEPHQDK